MNPETIKIRYRGQLIGGVWRNAKAKIVELPIPFLARSEKIGEVLCDPIGVFPYDDGMKLLELSGEDGPWVRVDSEKFISTEPERYVPSDKYRKYQHDKRSQAQINKNSALPPDQATADEQAPSLEIQTAQES